MSIVSYSQNFEDVMLWRALKDVNKGFYIDVGANDPSEDSVTKLFYDNGWCGINIDPIEEYYKKLLENRPEDINLKVALGSKEGEVEIWKSNVRGWESVVPSVISRHEANGFEGTKQLVPLTTLRSIVEKYNLNEVHFLKIDVEGFEKNVLEGANFDSFRPWVIVVEATEPDSKVDSFHHWEHLITHYKYQHAYSDGLNRFYVAEEHGVRLNSFKYPPNIFDDFVLGKQKIAELSAAETESRALELEARAVELEARAVESEARAVELEARAVELEARAVESEAWAVESEVLATEAESRAAEAEAQAGTAHQLLKTMQNSTSWRITAPLRWSKSKIIPWSIDFIEHKVKGLLKYAGLYIGQARLNRCINKLLVHSYLYVKKRNSCKVLLIRFFGFIPSMRESLTKRVENDIITGYSLRARNKVKNQLTVEGRISNSYELGFDMELIDQIRTGDICDSLAGAENTEEVEHFVVHAFLALLYRMPSDFCVSHYSSLIKESGRYSTVIKKLTGSDEYKSRGYKKVVSL